jgi:hypothetical protein
MNLILKIKINKIFKTYSSYRPNLSNSISNGITFRLICSGRTVPVTDCLARSFWLLMTWLVLGQNRGRGYFLNIFRCSNDFTTQKVYFSG